MANATTMVGVRAALLDTTGASQTLVLDPDKKYSIRHMGKDNTGAADINDVKLELSKVNGADPDAAVANRTADTDQVIMKSDDVYVTVRGIHTVKYIAFGGAPQLNVVEPGRSYIEG